VFVVEPRGATPTAQAHPFDLGREWPIRVRLVPVGSWHTVSLEVHHIAVDGGSLDILLADLAAAYGGEALAEPGLSYAELLSREAPGVADTAWWAERLEGYRPLRLPTDRPRPADRSGRGSGFDLWVEPADYAGLLERAADLGVTPFTLLFTASTVMLANAAGADDLVVATPVTRRAHVASGLVGHFTQAMPLRTVLRDDETLADLARKTQRSIAEGLAHPNVDTAALAVSLGDGADLRRVEIAVQNEPDLEAIGSFPVRIEDPPPTSVDVDLQVTFFRPAEAGPMRVRVGYDADLFDPETAEGFGRRLLDVLRTVVSEPDSGWRESGPPESAPTDANDADPVAAEAVLPAGAQPTASGTNGPEQDGRLAALTAAVWREVLDADVPIKPDSDFFALGGNSFSAVQVALALRSATGQDVPVSVVFQNPQLTAFVAWWGANREPLAAPEAGNPTRPPNPLIPRADRSGRLPLSRAQRRLWMVEQGSSRGHEYEMAVGWLLPDTQVAAVRRAVGKLVEVHEILRTGYLVDDVGPVQRILADWRPQPLAFDDPDTDAATLARRMITRLRSAAGFDLTDGAPPLAIAVGRSAQGTVLVLNAHHICLDGVSIAVLTADMAAAIADRPLSIPDRQYADFAVWEAGRRADADATELEAWRADLSGAEAVRLPHGGSADVAPAHLEAEVKGRLIGLLRQSGVASGGTVFSGLLAAYALALFGVTGRTDIVVGTDAANRTVPGTEQMLGFFVNELALRLRLAPGQQLRDVLAEAIRVASAGLARQEVPFDSIVAAVNPVRDGDRIPLVSVKLILPNAPSADASEVSLLTDVDPSTSAEADAVLVLESSAADDDLRGSLEYAGGVTEATARWLLELFDLGLRALVEEPELTVEQFGERVAELSRGRLRSQRRLTRSPDLVALANRATPAQER
jgi:non-ribosomal peptide synthetase component F